MLSHVFYFPFLALQLSASILFFKEVNVGSNIKLLDGANSSLVYVDLHDSFHMESIDGEQLSHLSSEIIGFQTTSMRKIYAKKNPTD